MRRREFLRGTAALAGLAATRSPLDTAGWARRADAAPQPGTEWWLRGNFAPVEEEVTAHTLAVDGSIPRALNGLYVRNGSNAHDAANPHWFIGDVMVHGVHLEGGRAHWYRNRWVRTTTRVTCSRTCSTSTGTTSPSGCRTGSTPPGWQRTGSGVRRSRTAPRARSG